MTDTGIERAATGIDHVALQAMSAEYGPRDIRPVGVWDDGGRMLKCYAVARPGDFPDRALLDRARALAVTQSELDGAVGGTGLGAVVVHRGADGDYVVIMNWIGAFMTRLTLFTGPRAAPEELRPAPSGVGPCLWELAVIAHERESFQRNIVTGGSFEDWRADLMSGSA